MATTRSPGVVPVCLGSMLAAGYHRLHQALACKGRHVGPTACYRRYRTERTNWRYLFAANRLDGNLVRMFTSNRHGAVQRPVILGYLVAIASVVAAMAVLWLVGKAWHARPAVALFLVAVIISGWFGGAKPAVLAVTLSVVAFDYFSFPTTASAFDEMHL